MTEITTKRGLLLVAIMVNFTAAFGLSIWSIIIMFEDREFTLGTVAGVLAMFIVLPLFAAHFSTLKIIITPDGISSKSLFGTQVFDWKNVRSISVVPMYGYIPFIGYNILIAPKGDEYGMPIMASYFANRHELVKAIIEAAKEANPKVQVLGTLLDRYGPPPYGIFTDT